MGLEFRNGNPYYYHKIRKGSKVVSEYVGSGEMALITAELQEDENYSKKNNQELVSKK